MGFWLRFFFFFFPKVIYRDTSFTLTLPDSDLLHKSAFNWDILICLDALACSLYWLAATFKSFALLYSNTMLLKVDTHKALYYLNCKLGCEFQKSSICFASVCIRKYTLVFVWTSVHQCIHVAFPQL